MDSTVIFIIEKDPAEGNLLTYHLQNEKFMNVQLFHSGGECMRRIERGLVPDFIISDTHLPDMDGFTILEYLGNIKAGTRVIFFSPEEDQDLCHRLLKSGASDYILRNPNDINGITELVKNIRYLLKAGHPVEN